MFRDPWRIARKEEAASIVEGNLYMQVQNTKNTALGKNALHSPHFNARYCASQAPNRLISPAVTTFIYNNPT